MKFVRFTQREKVVQLHEANPLAYFYDTSTHAPYARDHSFVEDFSVFSPFMQYENVPVPGMSILSDSVEGVWQGLKIIKGKIDPSYFRGKGRKRYGIPTGHLYGGSKINYSEARKKIYVPTYKFMVSHLVQKENIDLIINRAFEDKVQYFFDVDENGDLGNLHSPLAHSSVLVNIINDLLMQNRRSRDLS